MCLCAVATLPHGAGISIGLQSLAGVTLPLRLCGAGGLTVQQAVDRIADACPRIDQLRAQRVAALNVAFTALGLQSVADLGDSQRRSVGLDFDDPTAAITPVGTETARVCDCSIGLPK